MHLYWCVYSANERSIPRATRCSNCWFSFLSLFFLSFSLSFVIRIQRFRLSCECIRPGCTCAYQQKLKMPICSNAFDRPKHFVSFDKIKHTKNLVYKLTQNISHHLCAFYLEHSTWFFEAEFVVVGSFFLLKIWSCIFNHARNFVRDQNNFNQVQLFPFSLFMNLRSNFNGTHFLLLLFVANLFKVHSWIIEKFQLITRTSFCCIPIKIPFFFFFYLVPFFLLLMCFVIDSIFF